MSNCPTNYMETAFSIFFYIFVKKYYYVIYHTYSTQPTMRLIVASGFWYEIIPELLVNRGFTRINIY